MGAAGPSPSRKIWLVNLFFGTGPAPTGVLLESVARALQDRGWRVEVIAGRAAYNTGAASKAGRFKGRVHWRYVGSGQASGLFGRLVCWVAFYIGAAWFAFSRRLPDKVLIMTTPPLLHAVFVLRNLFARRKTELVLWNQDTYPEILAAVDLLRPSSLAYRGLLAAQRWSTSRVLRVVVLDGGMEDLLRGHGAKRIDTIPNWEIEQGQPSASDEDPLVKRMREARARYRYAVLYSGNYGWGHNLGVLWEYLRREPRQRLFFFLFVGGGEKWGDLQRIREELDLDCLEATPYVPKSRMPGLIQAADFGLVALERACVGLMSPSKIHGYLACGKPLLYLGPPRSNVAEAIANFCCGMQAAEDDLEGWLGCVERIRSGAFDYDTAARNAARAARSRYIEAVGVRDLIAVLEQPD